MNNFFATTSPTRPGEQATTLLSSQPDPLMQAQSGNGLNLTLDVTTIATVGLVLAFTYSIVKTFRDKS